MQNVDVLNCVVGAGVDKNDIGLILIRVLGADMDPVYDVPRSCFNILFVVTLLSARVKHQVWRRGSSYIINEVSVRLTSHHVDVEPFPPQLVSQGFAEPAED